MDLNATNVTSGNTNYIEKGNQILGWIRYGIDKLQEGLIWISGIISKQFDVSQNNTYVAIILLISFFIGYKLMKVRYTTSEGRWMELLIVTGIIFAILKFL